MNHPAHLLGTVVLMSVPPRISMIGALKVNGYPVTSEEESLLSLWREKSAGMAVANPPRDERCAVTSRYYPRGQWVDLTGLERGGGIDE